jgi:hypothetical protein
MKYIKDEKRANLIPNNLEAQLRCKINGPNDERKFNVNYYTLSWLEENHIRTDDTSKQRKSKLFILNSII